METFILLNAEIWQYIIGIPMAIVIIIVLQYVFGYILGGMAKLSNRSIVRHGRTIYTPDTIDELNSDLTNKKDRVIELYKKIISRTNTKFDRVIEDKTLTKIDKLKKIEELFNNNIINQEELELLKKEIFEN